MPNYDFLSSDETLFSNPDALDPDFVPKLLPHREDEQFFIASCIKPLLADREGRHVLITGYPGIGKTAATKRILLDLEEQSDSIGQVSVNCWKHNSTHKVLTESLRQLGYKFSFANLRTDEVLALVEKQVQKFQGIVFVFDEIDKAEDTGFLYHLLEEKSHKTVIMITNDSEFLDKLDSRVKSRLLPEKTDFRAYTEPEILDILSQRVKYAFYQNTWTEESINLVAKESYDLGDVRAGIKLLKLAGEEAEFSSNKKIEPEHVKTAISKLSMHSDTEPDILKICKENSKNTSRELYNIYLKKKGDKSYRTFRRKLQELEAEGKLKITSQGQGEQNIVEFL